MFQTTQHGPYGGEGSTNWSVDSNNGGKIRKFSISHGCIIDGIGFEIGSDDCFTSTWFGGTGGNFSEVIAIFTVISFLIINVNTRYC